MKSALVIGGNGLLGRALLAELYNHAWDVKWTSRRAGDKSIYLDLSQKITSLPICDVTFVVAAVANYRGCEGNAIAFRTNVDGPIEVIKQALANGSFPVTVSSDAVEWSSSAYARHKAYVETVFRLSNVAILRPGKITAETAPDLARLMIKIGEERTPGVHRWP